MLVYFKETKSGSERPLSTTSILNNNAMNCPTVPVKCRNNYLYFNYNNNKMNYLNGEASIPVGVKKEVAALNDSSLFLSSSEQMMTTTNAKLYVLSSSPQALLQQQDIIAVSSVASTSSIPHHSPIQQVSPGSTTKSIMTNSKQLKRLSGTEV